MQTLVKDFNYVYINDKYTLFYLGDDFKTHVYREYKTKTNDLNILLEDIQELAKLGFRHNPYLIDNN